MQYYIVMLVGALKAVQCITVVTGWLGLSIIVRVRIRAMAREWDFSVFFFFFFLVCVKSDKHLCFAH